MTKLEYWWKRCASGLRATDHNELTLDQLAVLTRLIESFADKHGRNHRSPWDVCCEILEVIDLNECTPAQMTLLAAVLQQLSPEDTPTDNPHHLRVVPSN